MSTPPGFFAYGTLALSPVLEALVGRPIAGAPASLEGWARYRVRGALYPALVPESGARTEGSLYPALSPDELVLVDRFEGSLYERRCLEVRSGSAVRSAQVYVVSPGAEAALSNEPWDVAEFAARHLERFRSHCRDFRASAGAAPR